MALVHIADHGVVGGASNAAMGGKFRDGFLSAAASAAAARFGPINPMEGDGAIAFAVRTATAGIVGGTASALGGGKFSNGAYTAAFQHVLNSESPKFIRDMYLRVAAGDKKQMTIVNPNKLIAQDEYFGSDIDASSPGQKYHGECVSLVKYLANLGTTSGWSPGRYLVNDDPMMGPSPLKEGTVIATFNNKNVFSGHAAVFSRFATQNGVRGIVMFDQWVGRTPSFRFVPYRHGKGYISNDASRMRVLLINK